MNYLGEHKSRELLDLKTKWGFTDARLQPGMENCDICANDVFRDSWQSTGIERKAFDAPPPASLGQGDRRPGRPGRSGAIGEDDYRASAGRAGGQINERQVKRASDERSSVIAQ